MTACKLFECIKHFLIVNDSIFNTQFLDIVSLNTVLSKYTYESNNPT